MDEIDIDIIMSSLMADWPEYFPENTPPSQAVVTEGLSFRLVDNHPPRREDFRSTYEEYPKRKFSNSALISACGTSQFRVLKDILKKRELFPPLRSKKVAKGVLEPSLGMTMETFEPTHHTVWYLTSAQPQTIFEVLKEET